MSSASQSSNIQPSRLSNNAVSKPATKAPQAQNASPASTTNQSFSSSSAVFQQVKQTQASLARLSRAQQQLQIQQQQQQQQQLCQTNQSSQLQTTQQAKSTTFVDCLIRRFKDCFSEDFCTVPMFVVGSLSPGSDGTHLILPPCVSLGRQSISRFAGPKNLRLMNSIRESCKSIEELDLGGNKLTDLIEVYKILQYTPNLRFLNLSENDLSRSSPVVMAATCSASAAAYSNNMSATGWSSQRTCLGPINHEQQVVMRSRRHSSLGQSNVGSRVDETRRLAAAAALAQSKKTSSIVASKLASSASASVASRQSARQTPTRAESSKSGAVSRRHPAAGTSTMNLARSLSSLSAKDVRAATGPLSRLSAHCRSSASRQQDQATAETRQPTTCKSRLEKSKLNASTKLYADPIAETEHDVDMSASQQPVSSQTPVRPNSLQTGSSGASRSLIGNQSSSSGNFKRTFGSVKLLALNNTGCPWRVVCSILSRMPNLEELHVSLNNYERIDLEPADFRHSALKRLYLCNNPKLTSWEELDKLLIAFPSLEALSIADCNISQIPENLDRAREWRKLCGLNINGWPIEEWPVIDRLNQLPSLVDLKCRNLNILNDLEEPRHHLIARLPKLQRLNGSEIEEREHAEKSFLRFFMANSHLERPSRFHELVQIHGEILPVDVDVDLSPPSQASVRVVFLNRNRLCKENEDDILMSEDFLTKLMDTADSLALDRSQLMESMELGECQSNNPKHVRLFKDESQEIVALEVDLRQSVRKFKLTLAALFNLAAPNLILYYIDHEMVGLMGPELIKHNQKKLWNYNVRDGDQFIVEER